MKIFKDKKIGYALLFVLIVIFGILIYFAVIRDRERQESLFKKIDEKIVTREITIDGKTVNVEIASSRHKKARGLRFRDSLGENDGMLFLFGTEGLFTFWTKDMRFPIDIIWIDQDQKIVYIEENVPPCDTDECETYTSTEFSRYVVEVNAGWTAKNGVDVGDDVVIDKDSQAEAEIATD